MSEHEQVDGLESLVGETMRARAAGAPGAAGLLDLVEAGAARRARVRRGFAVGTSVALVTAVAASVSLLTAQAPQRGRSHGTVGAASASAPVAVQGGERSWDFHGLEVDTPAAWGLNLTDCGDPMANTVVVDDGGGTLACMPVNLPSVDFAQLATPRELPTLPAVHAVTVSGQPGTLGTEKMGDGRTLAVLTLPGLDAALEVETHSATLEASIIASARVVAVDDAGCASRVTGLYPSGPAQRPGAANQLVPGSPSGAVLCHYSGDLLGHSTPITGAKLIRLIGLLNGLQPGLKRSTAMDESLCAAGEEEGYIVKFDYSDGPAIDVYVHLDSCDRLGADSGSRTGGLTTAFGEAFIGTDNPGFGGSVTGAIS